MAFLASWAKIYFAGGEKNWLTLEEYNYNTSKPNFLWSKMDNGSSFWKGVTWALASIMPFYKWVLGNGKCISFWHAILAGGISLKTILLHRCSGVG